MISASTFSTSASSRRSTCYEAFIQDLLHGVGGSAVGDERRQSATNLQLGQGTVIDGDK